MTRLYVEDTDALGIGRPDAEPLATETIAEIVALIEALIESGHAYESGGDVYFRVRSFDGYGKLSNRDPDEMDQGEEAGTAAEGGPARLRALEGAQAGRGHRLALALGRGPARLAHRVLGDGREAARHRLRDPRRRLGPRLPPPRERDRADRGGARACRWRGSGCTTAWSASPRRRCRSRSATSSSSPRRSTASAPQTRCRLPQSPATTASRSSSPSRRSREAPARVERHPQLPRRAASRGRRARTPRRSSAARRFLDALADDFNTPRAWAALFELIAEGNRRPLPGARAALAELLAAARARVAARIRRPSSRTRRPRRCWPSASAPARSATSSAPTGSATELAELGWEVRDTPEGARLRAAAMDRMTEGDPQIVYGRRPVAEAKRGRRRVRRVWTAADLEPDELTRLAGLARPPGRRRRGRPLSLRRPGGAARPPEALVVALDQVQDPRNLGRGLPLGRGRRRRRGGDLRRGARRRSPPRPARRRRARSSTCAVARVTNLADWLARAKDAGAWIYGAEAQRSGPYTQADLTGKVVLVLGSEGRGLRRRVAASCDLLVSIPVARQGRAR